MTTKVKELLQEYDGSYCYNCKDILPSTKLFPFCGYRCAEFFDETAPVYLLKELDRRVRELKDL